MPQHTSAAKRVRQDARRRLRNRQHKLRVRTMMKDLQATTDREAAESKLREVKAQLDRMATRRIVHPNKAANLKSSLERHVQSLG
jgi:small subunit ribosomal protein S20